MIRIQVARTGAGILALLLSMAGILGSADLGRAALEKPAYTSGDRWVYVLQGSLSSLPGINASLNGSFQLGLSGIVEVDVLGPTALVPGGVQVDTHASGFLNGTFAVPRVGALHASGTFSSDASESWEGTDYLPVASNSSAGYVVAVSAGITLSATANLWVNATTSYGALPPFNLSVGGSASVSFSSDVNATTSFSVFGFSERMANRTTVAGTWTRQVLARENVSVEAGVFPAYHLNQSLGGFPGLGIAVPAAGANESAWFSDQVGNYVKRDAYVNGTPVAEMRLKSYTYPAAPSGLSLADTLLLIAIPVAAAAILVLLLLRRRKVRSQEAKGSSGVGPVGELPPKEPGGQS